MNWSVFPKNLCFARSVDTEAVPTVCGSSLRNVGETRLCPGGYNQPPRGVFNSPNPNIDESKAVESFLMKLVVPPLGCSVCSD